MIIRFSRLTAKQSVFRYAIFSMLGVREAGSWMPVGRARSIYLSDRNSSRLTGHVWGTGSGGRSSLAAGIRRSARW